MLRLKYSERVVVLDLIVVKDIIGNGKPGDFFAVNTDVRSGDSIFGRNVLKRHGILWYLL